MFEGDRLAPQEPLHFIVTVFAMPNLVDLYNAVPFFVIGQKYGFSEAQAPEVITQILDQVQKEKS